MTRTPNTKFETVADMAAWLVASPTYRTDAKFQLRDWTHREWDDEEAGKVWQEEDNAIQMVWRRDFETPSEDGRTYTFDEEGYRAADAARDEKQREVNSRRPAQHNETNFSLEQAHGSTIELSEELGRQVDAIWTKRPTYRGSSYTQRVGTMTVAGMLKRMKADTGLKEAINAAQTKAEHQQEVNNINYARKQIRQNAAEIVALIEKAQLGDESEQIAILLNNLAVLKEQEL